jgi:hypothetical protein
MRPESANPAFARRSAASRMPAGLMLAGLLLTLAGCGPPRAVIYRSDWVNVIDKYGALPANKALVLNTETGRYDIADKAGTSDEAVEKAMTACMQKARGARSRCMLVYMNGLTVGDVTQFFTLRPADIGT